MGCFYPRDAWRAKRVNLETGKRSLVFNRSQGFSDQALQVPCGKCDGCRADVSRMWAIRCYQESSLYDQNAFLTLTLDDKHLGDGKIHKKHLQDFFKRLRHEYDFRYFACGEYGGSTRRPHYHALIFGQDFLSYKNIQINENLFCNPELAEAWGAGLVSCAPVTMASCCYVAGYVNKKIGDADTFCLMSRGRRPDGGIGYRWIQKYWKDVANNGFVVIEGKEEAVPPRYLSWMEYELFHVKQMRKAKVEKRLREQGFFEIYREAAAKEVYLKQRLYERKLKEKIK